MADPDTLADLEARVARVQGGSKDSLLLGTSAYTHLMAAMAEHGLDGDVVALLVNAPGSVNCYGERLKDGVVFRAANMTIGGSGTSVKGTIKYQDASAIGNFKPGHLVPLEDLSTRVADMGKYVALVNFELDPDDIDLRSFRYD